MQRLGPITLNGNILSIYAGGTLSKNTYKWYRDGLPVATIVGDSTYRMTVPGVYGVYVTNSVARNGALVSENFSPSLPVILTSFSAKPLPNQNNLTWKTTSETNNKGFEIEKSIDARTFETIGFVEGNGDSKELNNYHFTDPSPFNITYYRLKQLDYDGKFEHSKIIVARNTPEWKVYPNPAQNHLTISGLRNKENVSIFNQRGALVSKQVTDLNGSVDLRNLANGIYNLQIGGEAKKVLIQK